MNLAEILVIVFQEMLKEVDKEGKGFATFDEFLSLMTRRLNPAENDEELFIAFNVFDRVKVQDYK